MFLCYILAKIPAEKIYKINVVEGIHNYAIVEDFNDGINYNYWNVFERGNNYNQELQYYNSNNVTVQDGYLNMESRKEDYLEHRYTSGAVDTKGKFEFLYGKVIVRAKPAIGRGLLSAIWLLPADETLLPEIDLVEVLGSKPTDIWTGVHYMSNTVLMSNFNTNVSNYDFSIYELDWKENEIKCYINGKLIYKTNVGVPNKKMYLIMNLAVGGVWPGKPSDSIFPSKFIIDYVIVTPEAGIEL